MQGLVFASKKSPQSNPSAACCPRSWQRGRVRAAKAVLGKGTLVFVRGNHQGPPVTPHLTGGKHTLQRPKTKKTGA